MELRSKELLHIQDEQASILNTTFMEQRAMSSQLQRLATANKLMSEQVKILQNNTQEVVETTSWFGQVTLLESRLRVVHAVLAQLRGYMARFLSGWQAAAQHLLSPALLPADEFRTTLGQIRNNLPPGLDLLVTPTEDHMGSHYASCRVTVVNIPQGLMLYIDIPLVVPGRSFTLLRAMPLPVPTSEREVFSYIQPDFPYLAISRNHEFYLKMDRDDLATCRDGVVRLCNPQHALQRAGDAVATDCLISLFRGDGGHSKAACDVRLARNPAPVYHRTPGTTTWLYSLSEPEVLIPHCLGASPKTPAPQTLHGQGSLTLPPGCSATVKGALLSSPAHFQSAYAGAAQPFILPSLPDDAMTNISLGLADLPKATFTQIDQLLNTTWGMDAQTAGHTGIRLQAVRDKIEEIKKDDAQAALETLHLAGSLSTGTLLFLLVGGVLFYCYCCPRGAPQCTAAPQQWLPLPQAPPTQYFPSPAPAVHYFREPASLRHTLERETPFQGVA